MDRTHHIEKKVLPPVRTLARSPQRVSSIFRRGYCFQEGERDDLKTTKFKVFLCPTGVISAAGSILSFLSNQDLCGLLLTSFGD